MHRDAIPHRASRAHFGTHHIAEKDVPVDASELAEELSVRLAAPGYQPPMLPRAALRVLELSRSPNISMRAVVALFEDEPALAGRVLKMARSASYAADPSRVRTLQDAAVRLGIKTVRDIVLDASVNSRVFRAPPYTEAMESLHRHSRVVARLTPLICRNAGAAMDDAFVAGLFHDIGMVVLLHALSERAAERRVSLALAWPALVELHMTVGQSIAQAWVLPSDVEAAIASHHSFRDDRGAILPAALYVADTLADELGAPASPDGHLSEARSQLMLDRACEVLSLDAEKLAYVRRQATEMIGQMEP